MDTVGAYEAKTHLSQLLDRVAAGERIAISKHGVPVAILQPVNPSKGEPTSKVIAEMKTLREGRRLNGILIRKMIEEGTAMKTPRFVLDASVAMAWCFEDESRGYADAVLDSLDSGQAEAPAVWPLEVGNVLLVAERKKCLTRIELARVFSIFLAHYRSSSNRRARNACCRR